MKLKISKDTFQITSLFWFVWLLNLSSCLMQLENSLPSSPHACTGSHTCTLCASLSCLLCLVWPKHKQLFRIVFACGWKPKLFHVWELALHQWMSLLRSLLITVSMVIFGGGMVITRMSQKEDFQEHCNGILSWNPMRLDLKSRK